jgi:hypothetical protein
MHGEARRDEADKASHGKAGTLAGPSESGKME